MTKPSKFPYEIFGLDASGLEVVTSANTPLTAFGKTLGLGDTLTVTAEIYELNCDRFGDSFLDYTPEQQVETWKRQRFGVGPVPESVLTARRDSELATLIEERDQLLRNNPHLAKASNGALRLSEIDRALAR